MHTNEFVKIFLGLKNYDRIFLRIRVRNRDMKIDFKSKQTKVVIVILCVILVPIIFNQAKSLVTGLYTAFLMQQPKTVETAKPISKEIYPEYQSTGRIAANLSVDIIARVSGWLEHEYILAAKNARATVNENTAVYKNSETDLKRATELLKEDLVSREYYDNALTDRNKYRAALDGSKAELAQANLNLSYTNITSPMDGRIGKTNYSVGNYVTASSGVIAQIYSTNPMKVTFPLKSGDFIELKKYYRENPND